MTVAASPLDRLKAAVDSFLDPKIDREKRIRSSLQMLKNSSIRLSEWERVVAELPMGGPFPGGGTLASASSLAGQLAREERDELSQHIAENVERLRLSHPELRKEYEYQFS